MDDDSDELAPPGLAELSKYLSWSAEELLRQSPLICSVPDEHRRTPPKPSQTSPSFTDIVNRLIPALQRIPVRLAPDLDPHPEKPQSRRSFSQKELDVLETWWQAHADHPYATRVQLGDLTSRTSLSESQIRTWLINKRQRTREGRSDRRK
jgi:hypothetical protein